MKTTRQKLGISGEDVASQYLARKGYCILKRNFRWGRGELDIICRDGKDIVVVEVKSISQSGFGLGGERISYKKQREIIRTSYGYLHIFPLEDDQGLRFDVLLIDFRCYPAKVTHFKSAFWET
jgi:putative endonuclease